MKPPEALKREISAGIATLQRRAGSSSDPDEKQALTEIVRELNGQRTSVNRATSLQVAASVAAVIALLEQAVAAARRGPFDGYLSAIEGHLSRLYRLSGKIHRDEGLSKAVVRAARSPRSRSARSSGRKSVARARTRDTAAPAPALLTSTKFPDLREEYRDCFERCSARDTFGGNIAYYTRRLQQGRPNYELVEQMLGVPWAFVGIIHGMECGFNFYGHLHNGDPLKARTVRVPKGYPKSGEPPFTWLQSAVDALWLKKLERVTDWSVPHMLYLLEAYNGFGYRRRGLPSPYLWSFSNLYEKGKFVQDGKFDPEAVSRQCGAALMLKSVLAA